MNTSQNGVFFTVTVYDLVTYSSFSLLTPPNAASATYDAAATDQQQSACCHHWSWATHVIADEEGSVQSEGTVTW